MTTSYEVRQVAGSQTTVISLTGQIDRNASRDMATAYDVALEFDPQTVALDFTGVEYINSTGIALIVSLLGRARAEGRAVHAFGLTDHYRHIFDITRLSDFIEVFTDREAAVAST